MAYLKPIPSVKEHEELKQDMKKISDKYSNLSLKINAKKCKAMLLAPSNKQYNLEVRIGGEILSKCKTFDNWASIFFGPEVMLQEPCLADHDQVQAGHRGTLQNHPKVGTNGSLPKALQDHNRTNDDICHRSLVPIAEDPL